MNEYDVYTTQLILGALLNTPELKDLYRNSDEFKIMVDSLVKTLPKIIEEFSDTVQMFKGDPRRADHISRELNLRRLRARREEAAERVEKRYTETLNQIFNRR